MTDYVKQRRLKADKRSRTLVAVAIPTRSHDTSLSITILTMVLLINRVFRLIIERMVLSRKKDVTVKFTKLNSLNKGR
jgi:hypothetical protein